MPKIIRNFGMNNAGASTRLLSASQHRTAFFLSAHAAETYFIAFGDAAVLNSGIGIQPLSQGVWIRKEDVGELIEGQINFIATGAGTFGVAEVVGQ